MAATVLVIGAFGHIGSQLIRVLSSRYRIIAVDNMHTQRYCSAMNLPKQDIRVRIEDFSKIPDELLEISDAVIHLAAIVDAASSFDKEAEISRVNVDETAAL